MIGLKALAAQARHIEYEDDCEDNSERAQAIREALEAILEQQVVES